MGRFVAAAITLAASSSQFVAAQTWCGKNYKSTSPVVPPEGHFPTPGTTTTPLLAFRCSPAIKPYLPEDVGSPIDSTSNSILIDAVITQTQVKGAAPLNTSSPSGQINVSVSAGSTVLAAGVVQLNTQKTALPFDLSKLTPQTAPYNLTCTATFKDQTFTTSELLTYLPAKPATIGSVTKMDLRTGALLARPADGKGGAYKAVLPVGFYTAFDNYLAKDPTIPATLKSQGFNIIHIVPTFADLTALDEVLDAMQAAGLYLMYDMRFDYQNATSVTAQVNRIKSRPNLLLWYTADEPDGTSDPLDATVKSYNLITGLDGGDGKGGSGYHPVSLVLNCQDFYFTEYTTGSDIVMQDAYMIGNNVTHSTVWDTACTPDYGDCGCDNCKGVFEDISDRMDEFRDRLWINGWERTKAVWTVPQGFGNDTYWKRYPTGKEFVVQSVLGINHGGLGVISWDDPTSSDIKASASILAKSLPSIEPFVLSPAATYKQVSLSRVDVATWTVSEKGTLVLATNLNYATASVALSQLGLASTAQVQSQVMDSGAKGAAGANTLSFESVGSGAWIVNGTDPAGWKSAANNALGLRPFWPVFV